MWTVSQAILLILTTAHAKVTTGEQEHNVTKREIDQQIIGGSAVSMPTAVLILIKPDEDTTNTCSGTILSEDIILSAGHCFDIPGSYANVTTIVAGVSDLRNYLTGEPHIAQVFNVERVTNHPRYRHVDGGPGEQEELVWDLAIIKLSSKMKIETNPNMEAVKLPPPGMRHVGKKVRVGGWGRFKPNSGASLIHQAIDVMIYPDEKCSDTYDFGEYLPSLMFCAGERGQTTCRGDSGSGALFNWNNKKILIGVLSFGTKGCKTASVFQRVEKSLPWIFRETNLRPAYEVFEDDLLYEEFLDDVDVGALSPTFKKGTGFPVVFHKDEEFTIEKDNLIGTLSYLGKQYRIVFDLFVSSYPSSGGNSVLHFTIGGNIVQYGDRTPGIWLKSSERIYIASAINGTNPNEAFNTIVGSQPSGKWHKVEISQIASGNEFIFSYKVNGVDYWTTVNTQTEEFKDVQMYASDAYYGPADAKIRNITVQTMND